MHISSSSGSLILRLAYGYSVVENDDPLVKIAEDAMHGFARASEPGAFWVDNFPISMYDILLLCTHLVDLLII